MGKWGLHARSESTGELYSLEISVEPDLSTIRCSCQAGAMGTLCKHRLGLFYGSHADFDGINKNDFEQMVIALQGSKIASEVRALHEYELAAEEIKKKINKSKKMIARLMSGDSR